MFISYGADILCSIDQLEIVTFSDLMAPLEKE